METVKGKMLVGPILALVGAILLLIAGLIGLTNPLMQALMVILPIVALSFVMSIILGVLALAGAFMAITGKKQGNYLTLIAGLIGTVGMFIPITPLGVPMLVYTFIFIDPILILIGGILGVLLKE